MDNGSSGKTLFEGEEGSADNWRAVNAPPSLPVIQLAIRVQPGASSSQIVGWISGADGSRVLKIRLRAPAVEGQANAALIDFLAKTLSIRPRQVLIDRGGKSREKLIAIEGVTMEQIEALVGK